MEKEEKELLKKNKKRPAMKKEHRFLLFVLGLAFVLTGGFGSYYYSRPYEKNKEETELSYKIQADSSYRVRLKENELYEEKVLGEGRMYSSKLTDEIDIDFEALIHTDKEAEISGNYRITALVEGFGNRGEEKKSVYTKGFELKKSDFLHKESREAGIKESITVNPQYYRNHLENAEDILGSSLNRDCHILFEADVRINGKLETISYDFPLYVGSDELYELNKPQPLQIEEALKHDTGVPLRPELRIYLPFLITSVFGILVLLLAILVFRNKEKEELKTEGLIRLMKRFGSRMIEMNSYPDEEEWAVLQVKNMIGMIELSEEIRRPILYCSDSRGLPEKNSFYILGPDYLYVYRYEGR